MLRNREITDFVQYTYIDDIVVKYRRMPNNEDIDNRIEQLTHNLKQVNLEATKIQEELDSLITVKRELRQHRQIGEANNDEQTSHNTSGGSTGVVVGDAVVITDYYGGYFQRSGIVQRVTPCYLFIDIGEIDGPYVIQKHKHNVKKLAEQRRQAIAIRIKTARKERNRLVREKKKEIVRIREEDRYVRAERDRIHYSNNRRGESSDSD